MNASPLPGVGLGLRAPHYRRILSGPTGVPWFEATSENYLGGPDGGGGRPLEILRAVRRDHPIALHGVSLNLGGTDPLNIPLVKRLKALADDIQPAFLSDHLCWTGAGGQNLHDLLPLPYTHSALDHVARRVDRAQSLLKRRLLVENVSSYLSYADDAFPEWTFLSELARRTGCGLLLDVNNIHVSAVNHGFRGEDFLRGVPADAVGYIHLAGYSVNDGILIDTHDHAVWPPVWALYRKALSLLGDKPTLIEWDDKIPSFDRLKKEAAHAERIRRTVLRPRPNARKPNAAPFTAGVP